MKLKSVNNIVALLAKNTRYTFEDTLLCVTDIHTHTETDTLTSQQEKNMFVLQLS